MTQAELFELARLLNRLGAEVELEKEEAEAYLPDISNGDDIRDFYLPRVSEGFYFNPKVFRKLLGIR
jgi:hypothetical protein